MKKLFIKGLVSGLGFALGLLVIALPIYALQDNSAAHDIGSYDITPLGYEFTWVEEHPTAAEYGMMFGTKVNQVQYGDIVVGYDINGIEITKRGIRITFDKLPSTTAITKLDYENSSSGYKRSGGTTMADRLSTLDISGR